MKFRGKKTGLALECRVDFGKTLGLRFKSVQTRTQSTSVPPSHFIRCLRAFLCAMNKQHENAKCSDVNCLDRTSSRWLLVGLSKGFGRGLPRHRRAESVAHLVPDRFYDVGRTVWGSFTDTNASSEKSKRHWSATLCHISSLRLLFS